jgi:AraC-like DNA-binding protein
MTARAREQVKFWRDTALGVELLRASYVTHAFSRHTHEGYAIGVIDAGVEEFNYQGATHRAAANQIVIVHPGEVHTGHAGTPAGWAYRMFYPSVELLQSIVDLSEVQTIPYFPNPVIQDPELLEQLRRLHMALEAVDSRLERESRFVWAFAQLVMRFAEHRPCIRPLGRESQAVQQMLQYLNAHVAEAIALTDLAHLTQLTPLRLLRLFQREVGLPPHAYLVQRRVERAKQLLATGMPIAAAAFESGFTDQSHLNRHFKRFVGVTPGQYAAGMDSAATRPAKRGILDKSCRTLLDCSC